MTLYLPSKVGQAPDQLSEKVDRPLAARGLRRLVSILKNIFSRSDSYSLAQAEFRTIDRGSLWETKHHLPEDKVQAKQLCIDSALCQYPYKHNDAEVTEAHDVDGGALAGKTLNPGTFTLLEDSETSSELADFLSALDSHPHFQGRLKHHKGLIYDTSTGLVATVFKDNKTGQVKLVFGGTTAGQKLPFPDNKKLLLHQTMADAANFIGRSTPECYEQASIMTAITKEHFDPNNEGRVSVVGHSLGGALSQYASIMQRVPATCFSSAAIGKQALIDLARHSDGLDPSWVKENIVQVMVKGDPVSNPLGLKRYSSKFAPTNLGSRIVLEGQRRLYSDPVVGRHMHSHKHVHRAVQNHLQKAN